MNKSRELFTNWFKSPHKWTFKNAYRHNNTGEILAEGYNMAIREMQETLKETT